MRVFLTGGTGFLGGALVARLSAKGHEVVALARPGSRTAALEQMGARIAPGDITDRESVRAAIAGAHVVYHAAAWYELGVRDLERMRAVNVEGTRNVLELAAEAGARAIVHTSSVAALGSTGGSVADEEHPHPGKFGSAYERTKHEAHALARSLAEQGAPVRIVLPGTIFGAADRSLVARLFRAHLGGMLLARAFATMPMSLVEVDDCAAGLELAAERGRRGREYILVAEVVRMGDWMDRMDEITGLGTPRRELPLGLLRAASKVFPLLAPVVGLAPDTLRDGLAMAEGHTWAFSGERARRELGWAPTEFDVALARTLIAFDKRGGARFQPRTDRGRAALLAARARAAGESAATASRQRAQA